MMLGDFDTSAVIYGKFTTVRPSTGAPYTLAGTPALSVYKDSSTTQSTMGVTLTVDFDSVTGLNHFAIDTSADGTFYSAGSFFDVVITTGTVDSVSAVGFVVASFTLRKNSALKPTTAGRTLDVSAGGEAGLDWANIGSPTTAVNLSATSVKTATDVETDTQDIQTRLPAALVSGRMDASVGAYQSGQTPLQPTVAGRTLDVSATGEAGIDWANIGAPTTTVNLSGTTIGTAAAVTGLTVANLDVAVSTRLATVSYTAPDNTTIASIYSAIDTEIGAIKAKTDQMVFTTANQLDVRVMTNSDKTGYSIAGTKTTLDALNDITAGGVWDVTLASHLTGGTTGAALNAAGAAGDPWSTALPGAYVAGSAGYIVGTNLNATVTSRLATSGYSAPLDAAGTRAAVGLAAANLDTQLDALPTATENADTLLKRDWTAISGEAGRSVLNALRFLRNKWSISGGALTVKKEDDSTTAWTGAVTTTAGDPTSSIDPA